MSFHINAKREDIAETVLLPGDPKRAEWMAHHYLEDHYCYNDVRGMLGFTGNYRGKRVSIQGSGMGIPSIMIYAHELINEYSVQNLIRVGSAGSYQKDVEINDLVLALSASTTSNIISRRFGSDVFAPTMSSKLLLKTIEKAKDLGTNLKMGNVLSVDEFYELSSGQIDKWSNRNILCVEMESAGLYTIAAENGVHAMSLLTISDSILDDKHLSHAQKESSFDLMTTLALDVAVTL